MPRTEVRSEQLRDKSVQVVDLSDFAVSKRTTGLTIDVQAGKIQKRNTVYTVAAQEVGVQDGNTETSPVPAFLANYNTDYTDVKVPLTPTATNGTYISTDTATKKFGAGSVYFNPPNSSTDVKLTYAPNSVFNWAADFTIDCWVKWEAGNFSSTYKTIWSNGNWTTGGIALMQVNADGRFIVLYNGNFQHVGTTNTHDGNFHHIAVTRSGSTIRMFVDGVSEGTGEAWTNAFTGGSFFLSHSPFNPNVSYFPWTGWIDEIRILDDEAQWTSNFTPPVAAYNTNPGPATNYIELSSTGVASANLVGFTAGYTPLALAIAGGVGNVETVTDKRAWFLSGIAPNNATYITQVADPELTNEQALGSLATGLLKNTTTTGVLSIAVEGTDYYKPGGTDVVVSDGGTGVSSFVPYAPVFGGSSGSTPVQSGTVGTLGQVLTSNGPGVLPSFQSPSGVSQADLDVVRDNIALVAFRLSSTNSVSVQKMEDGIVDEFEDETGVNTGESTNASYNSVSDYYSPTLLGSGNDANTKFLLQANGYGAQSKAIGCLTAGDGLNVADHADWDFGTGEFCIETWVKWFALPSSQTVFYNNSNAAGGTGITCYFESGSSLAIYINTGAAEISRSFTPVTNKWYHIVFQRYAGNLQIYVNGKQQGANVADAQNVSGSAQTLKIIENSGGTNTAQCWIKNYRVSNLARYTANFTPSTSLFSADSNTKLLLLGEESNGATTFIDSSTSAKTVTTINSTKLVYTSDYRSSTFLDTEISTVKSVTDFGDSKVISKLFNNTAGFFDGASTVRIADHADWDFGTGNFTIETWVMFSTIDSSTRHFLSRSVDANYSFYYTSSSLNFAINNATPISRPWTVSINTWYHIAVVRDGSGLALYIDGIKQGASVANTTDLTYTTEIALGARSDNSAFFTGWMKEFRISNSARYSATFTPSSSQFTSDSNTKLLLHFDSTATTPLSSCITFDGTGDYLTVPDSGDWAFGTADFTIETWVRTNSTSATTLVSQGSASTDYGTLNWTGSAWDFRWYVSNSLQFSITASMTIITRQWYHVAVTRSGTAWTLWVNGRSVATATSSASYPNYTGALGIGVLYAAGDFGQYLNGSMKGVRISNSARYSTAFTPSTTAFTADSNTKLLLLGNESNGATTFIDSETTPKTVTTVGNTVISYEEDYRDTIFIDSGNTVHYPYALESQRAKVDFIAPFGSGSLNFDGTSDYLTTPDHADWDFGTGDWTIDCWVRFATNPASTAPVAIGTVSDGILLAVYDTGGVAGFHVYFLGTEYYTSHAYTPIKDRWYHFAACRSGNSLRLFINGTQNGNTEDVTGKNMSAPTTGVFIGASASLGALLNGGMDNVRISSTARYTANFNPPSSEYDIGTTQNMDLRSQAFTATAEPGTARIVLFTEHIDSVTINTDLLAYASKDNGTTWNLATLVNEGLYETGKNILAANVALTSSGTNLRWRVATANNKNLYLHGAGLFWRA